MSEIVPDPEPALEGLPSDRRAFMKRLILTSAVATPVVSSFSMSGVSAVYAAKPLSSIGGNMYIMPPHGGNMYIMPPHGGNMTFDS